MKKKDGNKKKIRLNTLRQYNQNPLLCAVSHYFQCALLEINLLVFGIIKLVLTQQNSISISAFQNITTVDYVQSPHTL